MAEPEYVFGPFRVVPARQAVLRDGKPVPLGGRAFDVLHALVARAGRVVSRHELLDVVWPETTVEEQNLTVALSAIRRALASAVGGDRYIATVTGRGYRFMAPVRVEPEPEPAAPDEPALSNLPTALVPLIGRDEDLAAVGALLGQARLVTLSGAGGVGKTRLALSIGQAELARRPDGVWLVELAALTSPELVAGTVASVLGLSPRADRPAAELVVAFLRRRQALLVLDNCEHLVDAVARLAATILGACPGVGVLATSREALRMPGEQVYYVPSLAVPEASATLDAGSAMQYGAVRLFVERAAAAGSPRLSDRDAPAVGEICRRLDGIALAIELAAPRLRMLGAEGLLGRLADRLDLLTGGSRVALPRHQTLRALLDWSHGLLGEGERTLLRQLGVLAGSWTLEAAVAVAGDGREAEVLDRLTSLVDKSLVQIEAGPRGMRYRFLETMRHYAVEKLREAGDAGAARRHAQYMVRLLVATDQSYETTPTEQWIDALGGEIDNLRAAIAWAFGPDGDADIGIELVAYSRLLYMETALTAEHRGWVEAALARLHPGTPDRIAARIFLRRSRRTTFGQQAAAEDAERAVALARRSGEPFLIAYALMALARPHLAPGGRLVGDAILVEAEALVRPFGLTNILAGILSDRAVAAVLAGDQTRALALAEEGIAIARATGGHRALVILLGNLSEFHFAFGDTAGAIAAAKEAIVVALATRGARPTECNTRGNLGAYLLVAGDTDAAAASLSAALRMAEQLDEHVMATWILQHLALVAARRGRLPDAARLLGHVDATLERLGRLQREATDEATWRLLLALIEAGLPSLERQCLGEEGAAMTRDAAVALALPPAADPA